jgi:hypothetical protein
VFVVIRRLGQARKLKRMVNTTVSITNLGGP